MKNTLYAIILLCVTLVGCGDDDNTTGSIDIACRGFFVENYGDSASTTFTTDDVSGVYIYSTPEGWTAWVSGSTIYATAPSEYSEDIEVTGDIYVRGSTTSGLSVSRTIEVGIVPYNNLDADMANSYVVSKPGEVFTFDPKGRGESVDSSAQTPVSCRVEWSTIDYPIRYVRMIDGRISFYTMVDEDYDDPTLVEGNAVISALDIDENVIWSWHIWVTDDYLGDTTSGSFMNRNIGARDNSNEDGYYIHDSYGLFYQWGRKDPFVYPTTYYGGGSEDTYIYDDYEDYVPHDYVEADSDVSLLSYAIEYPQTFIFGDPDNNYDWLATSNSGLWSTTKTIYDPSPRGWRVPTAEEMANAFPEPTATDYVTDDYGAEFGGELVMALGRKSYLNGYLDNLSSDGSYAPWAGYYWSCDTSGVNSSVFNFSLDNVTNPGSIIYRPYHTMQRANGAQIRCIRY